jgi:hypothetical protein
MLTTGVQTGKRRLLPAVPQVEIYEGKTQELTNQNLLLEVIVYPHVMCSALQHKADVVAAVVTRRKFLPIDARDFVVFGMHWIVDHAIDAG